VDDPRRRAHARAARLPLKTKGDLRYPVLFAMAIPMPTPPEVTRQTHQLMDEAENLARRTYLDQGLPHLAKLVSKLTVFQPPDSPSKPTEGAKNGLVRPGALTAALPLALLMTALGVCAIGFSIRPAPIPTPVVAAPTPAPRVPFTDAEVIDTLRLMAASASSAQVDGALAGQPQTLQSWDPNVDRTKTRPYESVLSAPMIADLQRRGTLTSIDREGRPEITWSGVSGPVCHLLVQNIYEDPSVHGVAVTVDGKDHSVSCAGDGHTIVFSPHL
jgi:hypothetical protein